MNKFWEFKALGNAGELFLYGEISDTSWWGDEITPAQFQKELAALGDISTLDVYINSPGGDIFAGFSLYNILNRHPAAKTVHIDGLAASAASVVAMAGDTIKMPANATMMIHNAWTYASGGAEDLRKTADELDRINDIQKSVLEQAGRLVKKGGRMVYATCSMLKRENQDVVEAFLAAHPDWHLVPAAEVLA